MLHEKVCLNVFCRKIVVHESCNKMIPVNCASLVCSVVMRVSVNFAIMTASSYIMWHMWFTPADDFFVLTNYVCSLRRLTWSIAYCGLYHVHGVSCLGHMCVLETKLHACVIAYSELLIWTHTCIIYVKFSTISNSLRMRICEIEKDDWGEY